MLSMLYALFVFNFLVFNEIFFDIVVIFAFTHRTLSRRKLR